MACACSALARHCARSLWGRGPARALPTRARRAALATLAPRTMEGHCTSERPPFLRRQPVLPRVSPAPHSARWLARVARLRATALALSGDEAQHVRFRRARAAPRWRHSFHTRRKGTARARSRRSFGASPCSHVPAIPLTARGLACACSALARLCALSLWGRGPARALPTRARRAVLATLAPCTMEGHCTSEKSPFLRRQPVLPRASPAPYFARWVCVFVLQTSRTLAYSPPIFFHQQATS